MGFKQFWKKWTIDKPAAFGDLLWELLVVQLAALLERLTLREIVAFIPVLILIVAYAHRIPIPPELMLIGDVLAYIDIFSVILLLSIVGRVTALWFFARQAANRAVQLATRLLIGVRRFDFRRGRESQERKKKRLLGQATSDDDHPAIGGLVWA